MVIIFAEKSDADSFMKEYSEKVLDGKHSLSFSFINPSLDWKHMINTTRINIA